MLDYDEVPGQEYDEVPKPGQVPAALENIDVPKILRQRGWYKKLKDYRVYKEIGKDLALAKKNKAKRDTIVTVKTVEPVKEHASFTNEVVMEYVAKQLGAMEQVEGKLKNRIEQFVLDVKEEALRNYPESQPKQYSKSLIDEDEFMVKAALDFEPLLRDIAILSGNEALHLIGSKEQYLAPDYQAIIKKNVQKFAGSMLQTEQDRMVSIIKAGLEEGLSIPNIRRNMSEAFDSMSKTQAEAISRTEVSRASSEAAVDAWKQTGEVEGKQWVTTDGGSDDECQELDGEIVWELGGNFYEAEGEFQNGDPPLHPNCQCVVIPVVDREKTFDVESMNKIEELKKDVDKRTKAYKELEAKQLEQDEYIEELEKLAGI